MQKLKRNKSFYIILFFIFLICVFSMAYLTKNICFDGDNYFFGNYYIGEGIFDSLFKDAFKIHGGGYTALFLTKFFCFGLPNLIGIHPAAFIGVPQGAIKGIFLFLCLISCSSFSVFFRKSKPIFLSVCLFIFSFFIFNIEHFSSSVIVNSNNFYRYIFTFTFFCLFINFLFKNLLLKSRKNNYFSLLVASISAIISGCNIEILIYCIAALYVFIIFYNIIISLFRLNIRKFNIDKNFYIPMICFISILSMYVTSAGYKIIVNQRGLETVNISKIPIIEFSKSYLEICFGYDVYFWIIFFVLFVTSFCTAKKRNELHKVILPLFLQISVLVVMYSLILCGKTMSNNFWIKRSDVLLLYELVTLIPAFMYLSYLVVKIKKYQDNVIYVITCFFVGLGISLLYMILMFHGSLSHYANLWLSYKKHLYINEKIMRYYILKDEVPVIRTPAHKNIVLTSVTAINPFTKKKEYKYKELQSAYFQKIYKTDEFERKGYIVDKEALNKFYNNGGKFTDRELKDLNFQKLLDDNFVLGN